MKAAKLKAVDRDYRNHLQAFLNVAAKAEKKSGKKTRLVYDRFDKFYNYKKAENEILKNGSKKSRFHGIEKILKKGGM